MQKNAISSITMTIYSSGKPMSSTAARKTGSLVKESKLSDFELKEFNRIFDWRTGYPLPDGRYLGWSGNEYKNGYTKFMPGIEMRIQAVIDFLDPRGKTILEPGSCEGVLSVQLPQICEKVVSLEVRPQNIALALTRLYLHDVHNCEVRMMDVRNLDHTIGRYDILFHSGLLYHMRNPVEHLYKIANISECLLLSTHYGDCNGLFNPTSISTRGKSYDGFIYNEGGWDEPLAGVEDHAVWLDRSALLSLIEDVGFSQINIVQDYDSFPGKAIIIVAKRTKSIKQRVFNFFR
jgi:Methyltransferase domain